MTEVIICIVVIVILMFSGVPVAYSFLFGSLFYLIFTHQSLGAVVTTSFNAANSYTFLTIPLFILAGRLMIATTIAQRLVNLAEVILRKVKGGMAAAIVLAAAFFGTITGSDIATATAVGNIMFPRMIQSGWERRYIGTVLAVAAPLGFMIPPNTNAIMYATVSSASVPALFLSTIIPGIIWAALIMLINRFMYKKYYHPENADEAYKKEVAQREAEGMARSTEILQTATSSIPAIIMPVIILGGIYTGIFTSTEAGGVGCLYAIVVGFIIVRSLKWKSIWECFTDTSKDLGVILLIVATSAVFNRILLFAQMPKLISEGMLSISSNPNIIILLILVVFLIAGCFLAPPVIIFVISPLLLPTARMVGVGDVQFGVILMVAIGIGLITPPLASNLFISARMAKINIADMFRPLMPYLFFAGVPMLLLVAYVPALSLWLPGLFGYQ